ncbi:hypothetical protein GCM10010960_12000 [Arenimonas maotaiensis]|uniref:Sulfotransferase family protein n=1 Tax=Arenimonas maotaiensis TaxID=1446479 RepID=A0A917CLF2_9GAMM|nr:tetratricopeptide repeat-containing sulfotransferase family protein [Arenimonas maotaiensis]GGF91645.1 hypothetical protein GCM10010960_12000 [Arenimonas maotaiensis]
MTDDTVLQTARAMLAAGDYDGATALACSEARRGDRHLGDWLREHLVGERLNAQAAGLMRALPKSGSVDDLIDQAALAQLAGDSRSAMAIARKALALQPDNAFALNHLGRALFNAGAAGEARSAFERAVAVAPGYSQAWHNLGHVLRAGRDFKAAEAAYRKAVAIAPDYQSALLNLALLQMGQGDNMSAVGTLRTLLDVNPSHAEGLLNLGICHHILREFDEAKAAFERSIAADPSQPRSLRHMGSLLRELQETHAAVDYYRKALTLAPQDADLRAELISTLELLSDLYAAEEAVREGLASTPSDSGILFESAKLHRRRGDHEGAWRILSAIDPARMNPRLVQSYHYECGTVADRTGRYDEAFKAYAKGNELSLTSIRARNTDQSALPAQMDRVQAWLAKGAPCAASGEDEDLGDDLCFLIGFPRSGTTLLDVMLDGHRQVLSIEEKPTMERVAFALDRLPGHYPDALSTLDRTGRERLRALYRSQIDGLRTPEHALVIDKMPIRTIHAPFIHRLFPNARFLFAERHPCDVVLSNFMQHYAVNEAMIHFTRMPSAVETYDRVMRLWQLAEGALPGLRVHRVRYESLVGDPDGVLRETCAFLGLPWQEGMSQHRDTVGQRKQIKTNSYHQVAEPLYQRSKYRWLNYRVQFEPYMATLQPHIDRMGY